MKNIPNQQAIQEDYEAMVAGINEVIDPIWRPNTKYHIEFTLKDIVDDDENVPGSDFKYYYGFKTAGTIGHYHNAPNVVYGNEYVRDNTTNTVELVNRDANGKLTNPDQYALTSLEQYIDYKRSYPNADGNLLQSKPLFYDANWAELRLFYVKAYVSHMFKDKWDAYGGTGNNFLPVIQTLDGADVLQAFKVFVQDPVSGVIMAHPMPPDIILSTIPQTEETWNPDENPLLPLELQLLQNMVEAEGGSCIIQGRYY